MVLTLGAASVASQFSDSLAYLLQQDAEKKLTFHNLPNNFPHIIQNDIDFLNGYYPGLGLYESFNRYIESVDEDFVLYEYNLTFSFVALIVVCLFYLYSAFKARSSKSTILQIKKL